MLTTAFSRRALAACFAAAVSWTGASQADPVTFKVPLSGAEELPPVQTAGSGVAELAYDSSSRTLKWAIAYSGLSGPATMAHFHGPAPRGSKAPVVMWLSKQGSPAESPITGQATLTPQQAEQFAAGQWYVNMHTQANPGGEIRGQAAPPSD